MLSGKAVFHQLKTAYAQAAQAIQDHKVNQPGGQLNQQAYSGAPNGANNPNQSSHNVAGSPDPQAAAHGQWQPQTHQQPQQTQQSQPLGPSYATPPTQNPYMPLQQPWQAPTGAGTPPLNQQASFPSPSLAQTFPQNQPPALIHQGSMSSMHPAQNGFPSSITSLPAQQTVTPYVPAPLTITPYAPSPPGTSALPSPPIGTVAVVPPYQPAQPGQYANGSFTASQQQQTSANSSPALSTQSGHWTPPAKPNTPPSQSHPFPGPPSGGQAFVAELDGLSISAPVATRPAASASQPTVAELGGQDSTAQSKLSSAVPGSQSGLSSQSEWCIVDEGTPTPTKKFSSLVDLLFNSLNATVEPKNTGRFEATKMMEVLKADTSSDNHHLLSQDSFRVISILYTLLDIPHVLLPSRPSLQPKPMTDPSVPPPLFSPRAATPNLMLSTSSTLLSLLQAPSKPLQPTIYTPSLDRPGFHTFMFIFAHARPAVFTTLVKQRCPKYDAKMYPDLAGLQVRRSEFRQVATEGFAVALRRAVESVKGSSVGIAAVVMPPPAPKEQRQQQHRPMVERCDSGPGILAGYGNAAVGAKDWGVHY